MLFIKQTAFYRKKMQEKKLLNSIDEIEAELILTRLLRSGIVDDGLFQKLYPLVKKMRPDLLLVLKLHDATGDLEELKCGLKRVLLMEQESKQGDCSLCWEYFVDTLLDLIEKGFLNEDEGNQLEHLLGKDSADIFCCEFIDL